MANRDFRINRLIVDFISAALDFIGISTVLKYDSEKDYSDDLSIPSSGYVRSIIGDGGSDVIHRSFTIPESDIVDGVVSLIGRTNDQGDQIIPSKATWAVETEDGSVGRYSNNTQTVDGLGSGGIEVYLVGVEAVEPPVEPLFLYNTTNRDMKYTINNSPVSDLLMLTGIELFPEDSLVLFLASSSTNQYFLLNENGNIQNTDGGVNIETIPHEWIIPLGTLGLAFGQS